MISADVKVSRDKSRVAVVRLVIRPSVASGLMFQAVSLAIVNRVSTPDGIGIVSPSGSL
jgi:hypothetical protein